MPSAFSMRHQITATKRRPQTFESLRGQSFITQSLHDAILSNKISNAYLFSGPHGVGKTSAARLFAAALQGTGAKRTKDSAAPPPSQDQVHATEVAYADWVSEGSAVDVIEIDGASHTGVNDVRAIREQVLYPPIEYSYKIYIIDEVHMLTQNAFNALLKTIEEPPEYIVFIFATTELQKVPATIRSRCQQFQFQKIHNKDIVLSIEDIAQEEGIAIDDAAKNLIATEAKGSLRDAYMLYDQIKSSATADGITESLVLHQLGMHGVLGLKKLAGGIVSEDEAESQKILHQIFAEGTSPLVVASFLMQLFRNTYCATLGIIPDVSVTSEIEKSILNTFTSGQCEHAVKRCVETLKEIHHSDFAQVEVELLTAELCSLSSYMPLSKIVQELRKLSKEPSSTADVMQKISSTLPKNMPNQDVLSKDVQPKHAVLGADAYGDVTMPNTQTEEQNDVFSRQEQEPARTSTATLSSAPIDRQEGGNVSQESFTLPQSDTGIRKNTIESSEPVSLSIIDTIVVKVSENEELAQALRAISRIWKESIILHVEIADHFMHRILSNHKRDVIEVFKTAIDIEDIVFHIRIQKVNHNQTLLEMQPILQGKMVRTDKDE